MREGMSEVPESEGGSASAGDMKTTHLLESFARIICSQNRSAKNQIKWDRDWAHDTARQATVSVNIAHLLFISAEWSKLNSVMKRNVLALQPDAVPDRRSRAASQNDPSAISPSAGVVSLNRRRAFRFAAIPQIPRLRLHVDSANALPWEARCLAYGLCHAAAAR